jgi:hypothetical protein
LPGPEIAARRLAGEPILDHEDRIELAYATDTLVSVLDHSPELLKARVLIMECTFLDTRKTRGLLAQIRRVLRGGLGAVGADVRQKVAEILRNLQDQLRNHAHKTKSAASQFHKLNAYAMLSAAGIDPNSVQGRRLRQELAGVGPRGTVSASAGQFTATGGPGVVVHGDLVLNGIQNVKELENALHKRSKQRSHRRRGTQ